MPGRADAWTASTVRGRIQALPNPDMSDSSPPLVRVHGNLVNGQKACVRELMPSIFAPRSKLDERGCLDPKDDGQAPIGRGPSVSFFFSLPPGFGSKSNRQRAQTSHSWRVLYPHQRAERDPCTAALRRPVCVLPNQSGITSAPAGLLGCSTERYLRSGQRDWAVSGALPADVTGRVTNLELPACRRREGSAPSRSRATLAELDM